MAKNFCVMLSSFGCLYDLTSGQRLSKANAISQRYRRGKRVAGRSVC